MVNKSGPQYVRRVIKTPIDQEVRDCNGKTMLYATKAQVDELKSKGYITPERGSVHNLKKPIGYVEVEVLPLTFKLGGHTFTLKQSHVLRQSDLVWPLNCAIDINHKDVDDPSNMNEFNELSYGDISLSVIGKGNAGKTVAAANRIEREFYAVLI